MINKVNLELSKDLPYIYSIKAVVRFEESLEEVHELSLNANLNVQKKLEGVSAKVTRTDQKGFEKIEVVYDSFDSKNLGWLFYGENLKEEKLLKLLQRLVKPVRFGMLV
jgi:hypothetical protein